MSNRLASLFPLLPPIQTPDATLFARAMTHLDSLSKPVGSLGQLEYAAARIYAIQQQEKLEIDPARIYTVAGDHGIVAEGVALHPQSITRLMVHNFLEGGAGINVLCATANVALRIVDAGCAGAPFPPHPLLIQERIASGTQNFAQQTAMEQEQCLAALQLGVRLAQQAAQDGCKTVGTGDMGIGNTSPSTALFCAFLGLNPLEITGPGAGLPTEAVRHKAAVLERALQRHELVIKSNDPLAILAALGGYEIATLAGLIIGAAACKLIVVVDGFISTAAYVAAAMFDPSVRHYCFMAHSSAEPGYVHIIDAMRTANIFPGDARLSPLLDLGLRLGEGTGAALAIFLLRAAGTIFNDMATLEQVLALTPAAHN